MDNKRFNDSSLVKFMSTEGLNLFLDTKNKKVLNAIFFFFDWLIYICLLMKLFSSISSFL